jgi:hypothetical protein
MGRHDAATALPTLTGEEPLKPSNAPHLHGIPPSNI